jgi:hypothetical protein
VRAGEDLLFAIELASPEVADDEVTLQSSDPAAIEVPAAVTIPKGERHFAFNARTLRPGNIEVIASLSGARIITPVRVTGLIVSEVFYKPATGDTNGLQWIELANQSNVPLDLSAYSIGAGTTDFMQTRLDLPLTIPARGCIVVGGPESSPANRSPIFALPRDLAPDLSLGTDQTAGVGLFAAAGMSATARPVDAVVYGAGNSTLHGPDGQIAPVWSGSAAGGSLRRVTDSVWAKTAAPTPGVCEILDAH